MPHPSTFSKVRERANPAIFEDLNNWIILDCMKGKQLRLVAQDSTDIPAYSHTDKYAQWGHRTQTDKALDKIRDNRRYSNCFPCGSNDKYDTAFLPKSSRQERKTPQKVHDKSDTGLHLS